MPINKDNAEKIIQMFDTSFKRGVARTYNRQNDGGFASIAATVDGVSHEQILDLARIAAAVPHKCNIRSSARQVTIYFA